MQQHQKSNIRVEFILLQQHGNNWVIVQWGSRHLTPTDATRLLN